MVRTWKYLYDRICSEENLRLAFRKARKGKGKKIYVKTFEANLYDELAKLKAELETQTYKPSPLHRFVIRDPKTRVIHAPAFRDRVVHHAICNILEPIFDKSFIFDSYASRKGKGTHAALTRFDLFKRKVSRNGMPSPNAKDGNMVCGWVLKADIWHYFPSVDHEILLKAVSRKVSDKKVIALLAIIAESYSTAPDKGMPLGALTSQLFANIYLNPMDHFIKERLRAKFYIRYLDDFVILERSKANLEAMKSEIERFLMGELKLALHPEKSKIVALHRGVGLLGFRVFYHYRLLRKSKIAEFRKRLASMKAASRGCPVGEERIAKSVAGCMAHAAWGNTYNIRKRFMEHFHIRD